VRGGGCWNMHMKRETLIPKTKKREKKQMENEEAIFLDPLIDNAVLKTNKEIEEFIRKNLSPEKIPSIFNDYIIKHNIIGIDNIDNKAFWKRMAYHTNHISSTINSYNFSPYLEKLLLKGRNKIPRVISIPTIKDRIVLYVLKETLHRVFPECVNNQLVNKKIKELANIISSKKNGKIIKIDLKGFYDSINQEILLGKIRRKSKSKLFLSLIDQAITNPTVPKGYEKTEKETYYKYLGIPQGLAISNILANIFLHEFDDKTVQQCEFYYRYVDDILLICDDNTYNEFYRQIVNDLQRIGLTINENKTKNFNITDEFVFLGYKINHQSLSVKDESVQKHLNSLYAMLCYYKRLIERKEEREKWLTDELLTNRLESEINEKITGAISDKKKYGWLFYFNAINDISLLYKMNNLLNCALIRIIPSNIRDKFKAKSYVRAYHEIKKNPKSGYIENYDVYDTMHKRLEYLNFRGYINPTETYSEEEIDYMFKTIRERNISRMQRDIGSLS
jgi:retron-type reverse transcriptase